MGGKRLTGTEMLRRGMIHKKRRIKVNNKLNAFGQEDDQTGTIEINKKKHKGDKQELADTILHEITHAKHPKMKEKNVYKSTPKKGKIPKRKVKQLLKKLKKGTY